MTMSDMYELILRIKGYDVWTSVLVIHSVIHILLMCSEGLMWGSQINAEKNLQL